MCIEDVMTPKWKCHTFIACISSTSTPFQKYFTPLYRATPVLNFMFWLLRCTLWLERIMSPNLKLSSLLIDRGPRGPPLPPPGDFCRHIFLKTMDLELPKSDCLQEIRWCVWLWRAFEDRYPLKNSKIQLWQWKKSILNSTYLQIMPVWVESFPYDLGWHFSTKYS